MPTLPTITVTDAQLTKLLTVFNDANGYKAWLIRELKNAVIANEMEALRVRQAAETEATRARLAAELDGAG